MQPKFSFAGLTINLIVRRRKNKIYHTVVYFLSAFSMIVHISFLCIYLKIADKKVLFLITYIFLWFSLYLEFLIHSNCVFLTTKKNTVKQKKKCYLLYDGGVKKRSGAFLLVLLVRCFIRIRFFLLLPRINVMLMFLRL